MKSVTEQPARRTSRTNEPAEREQDSGRADDQPQRRERLSRRNLVDVRSE